MIAAQVIVNAKLFVNAKFQLIFIKFGNHIIHVHRNKTVYRV